jgi:hypothetical protein
MLFGRGLFRWRSLRAQDVPGGDYPAAGLLLRAPGAPSKALSKRHRGRDDLRRQKDRRAPNPRLHFEQRGAETGALLLPSRVPPI